MTIYIQSQAVLLDLAYSVLALHNLLAARSCVCIVQPVHP